MSHSFIVIIVGPQFFIVSTSGGMHNFVKSMSMAAVGVVVLENLASWPDSTLVGYHDL